MNKLFMSFLAGIFGKSVKGMDVSKEGTTIIYGKSFMGVLYIKKIIRR